MFLKTIQEGLSPGNLPQTSAASEAATPQGLEPARPGTIVERSQPRPRQQPPRRWRWVIPLVLLVGLLVVWRFLSQGAQTVSLIQPTWTTITESIATTGRVYGVTETLVGSQATGVVDRLLVQEGDRVTAGQQLAILKHEVAAAQVTQAQAALDTARAQLAQVDRAPLASDVEAAAEQVRQAQAQLQQQRLAVSQAEQTVTQVQAQWRQLEAEHQLAAKQQARNAQLMARGFIAPSEVDTSQANLRVAEEKLQAQQQALALAQTNVRTAQAGVEAARANVGAQEARRRTVQTGTRHEDIAVARQRVQEAEGALQVARQQAANATVTAPFAGTVTNITTEVGQSVGTQGVLKLVSQEVEIRVDVDESNLADLAAGQAALLSSSAFPDGSFQGTVAKLAAAVDAARGTVTVTVAPSAPPDWLRPGQTVNVNIITNPAARRLLVPAPVLKRVGDRTVVLVVEAGQARQKIVVTRPPTTQGVPILSGVSATDRLIANTQGVQPGDAVRVAAPPREVQP